MAQRSAGLRLFIESGAEKTGSLPVAVGNDPIRRFDTAVYASNFQGPILVRHSNLRPQWEWTADGELQNSEREYPLLVARACADDASKLPTITLHVAEHDEWPAVNDPVGAFAIDLARCRDVVTTTRPSGWSLPQRSAGVPYVENVGPRDVDFVEYVLWCYRCAAAADCEEGIRW